MPEDARADLLAGTRHSLSAPSEQQRAGLLALNGYLRDILTHSARRGSDLHGGRIEFLIRSLPALHGKGPGASIRGASYRSGAPATE